MITITSDSLERIEIDGMVYEIRNGERLELTFRKSTIEEYSQDPFKMGGIHWNAKFARSKSSGNLGNKKSLAEILEP